MGKRIVKGFRFGRKTVRVIPADYPRFCLTDVCRCLELVNAGNASRQVARAFDLTTLERYPLETPKGDHPFNFVTLEQLQYVLNHSRSKKRIPFAEWLNAEVLPALSENPKAEETATPSDTVQTEAPRFTDADIDFIIKVVSENFNISPKLI